MANTRSVSTDTRLEASSTTRDEADIVDALLARRLPGVHASIVPSAFHARWQHHQESLAISEIEQVRERGHHLGVATSAMQQDEQRRPLRRARRRVEQVVAVAPLERQIEAVGAGRGARRPLVRVDRGEAIAPDEEPPTGEGDRHAEDGDDEEAEREEPLEASADAHVSHPLVTKRGRH
ncbi:MAG: hypothetical protein R3B59_06545 [Dehalococcoidia bacterium]